MVTRGWLWQLKPRLGSGSVLSFLMTVTMWHLLHALSSLPFLTVISWNYHPKYVPQHKLLLSTVLPPQGKHPARVLYIVIPWALSAVREEKPKQTWEFNTFEVVILFYIKPIHTDSKISKFPGALKILENKNYTCNGEIKYIILVCLGQNISYNTYIPQPSLALFYSFWIFFYFQRIFESLHLFMGFGCWNTFCESLN